ncbi:MAG: NAD-dependent epimerase/dehydratase family protein [Phycisphaerae bacterium]
MAEQRTALVTGGAGFIGSNLVRHLCDQGWRVRVLDDLSGGDASRLADVVDPQDVLAASVTDAAACAQAVAGCDVVFHLAAKVSVVESMAEPFAYHAVNTGGTLTLLEAARAAGVRAFVFSGTSAAYGDDPAQPKHEGMLPNPLSPYAVSKYAAERYVLAYARLHGLHAVGLRYFNVYGPNQNPKSQYGAAVPAIVSRLLANQRPTVYGDGEQTRDFVFVQDVVRANLLAAERPAAAGGVFNIGTGERISVNDLVRHATRLIGADLEPEYAPPRPGEVRDSLADISRAREHLSFAPQTDLAAGLAAYITYARTL